MLPQHLFAELWVVSLSLLSFGQHVEAGMFGSYGSYDLSPFPSSAIGLGGRLNLNLTSSLVLEGEGSYDFKHPRVEIATGGLNHVDVTTLRMGIIHGNAGLKVQGKDGNFFLFVKGGILSFQPDVRTTTVALKVSHFHNLVIALTKAFYILAAA